MTIQVAVIGGSDVVVLASDSASVLRDLETGADLAGGNRGKLHPLSARLPLALGTFGLAEFTAGADQCSTAGVAARCRAYFDGEALEAFTMRQVAERVAVELHREFAAAMDEIGRRGWPVPAEAPVGAWPHGTAGGLVVGYGSGGPPPEVWCAIVTAAGVAACERKSVGGPGRWGAAVSPGCEAAAAAIRSVIRGVVPRTLEHAAEMARELVNVQIAVDRKPRGIGATGGPVQLLGLAPGGPPRVLDLDQATAAA